METSFWDGWNFVTNRYGNFLLEWDRNFPIAIDPMILLVVQKLPIEED